MRAQAKTMRGKKNCLKAVRERVGVNLHVCQDSWLHWSMYLQERATVWIVFEYGAAATCNVSILHVSHLKILASFDIPVVLAASNVGIFTTGFTQAASLNAITTWIDVD
mmetsp:Transcript_16411/g.28814  ORF Transcript_16411/g.28814 Transcript_16411/m.28814 type:complete len:109 (-) Transcript_16411:108-434(-)